MAKNKISHRVLFPRYPRGLRSRLKQAAAEEARRNNNTRRREEPKQGGLVRRPKPTGVATTGVLGAPGHHAIIKRAQVAGDVRKGQL